MSRTDQVPISSKFNGKYNDMDKTEDDSDDELPEIKTLTLNQALEEAGGFGKFQMLYVPLAGLGFILNGFFIYNLNYKASILEKFNFIM